MSELMFFSEENDLFTFYCVQPFLFFELQITLIYVFTEKNKMTKLAGYAFFTSLFMAEVIAGSEGQWSDDGQVIVKALLLELNETL